jgi:hypothetical protein
MKRRLAFALVGLAISFASPTLAQDPALKTGSAQEREIYVRLGVPRIIQLN